MNPEKKFEPIIEFLLGSGEFESQWFGEVPDGEPKFWWRSKLREYAEKHEAKPDSGWIPVKDALRPFYLLAAEVGKNNSGLKDDRILYGYNEAEIKFSDLLKVIEVYESLPTTNP